MMLVTGMTVGTLFTLFVVPVFYSLIAAQHPADQPSVMPEKAEEQDLVMA
jgi:multidrug efflux pump